MGRCMGVMVAEGGAIGDSDGSTIVKIPRSNCIVPWVNILLLMSL